MRAHGLPRQGEAAHLRRAQRPDHPGRFCPHLPRVTPCRRRKRRPAPPVLCAGCPHRGFLLRREPVCRQSERRRALRGHRLLHARYQRAAQRAGYDHLHGQRHSSIIGLAKALELQGDTRKALGCLKDSTFFHSGIVLLIDVVNTEANVDCLHPRQFHHCHDRPSGQPRHGENLMGEPSPVVDIESLRARHGHIEGARARSRPARPARRAEGHRGGASPRRARS